MPEVWAAPQGEVVLECTDGARREKSRDNPVCRHGKEFYAEPHVGLWAHLRSTNCYLRAKFPESGWPGTTTIQEFSQ